MTDDPKVRLLYLSINIINLYENTIKQHYNFLMWFIKWDL